MLPGFELKSILLFVLADLLVHVVRLEAGRGYGDTYVFHFSASFSRLWNVMEGLWIASLGRLSSCPSIIRSVSQMMPRTIKRVDGRVVYILTDMK